MEAEAIWVYLRPRGWREALWLNFSRGPRIYSSDIATNRQNTHADK